MLPLFQTKDRPIFFIVTLVYTCRAFFAVSSENICLIYCFGHSSSQSVSQWNSFFPLKYIVYKCFSCFRPEMGQFFSLSHLSTLFALFLVYHQKIFIPYIGLVTVRLSLICIETLFLLYIQMSTNVSQWNSFFPLKYIVYKCFSCFRPRMGQFFNLKMSLRFPCRGNTIIDYFSHTSSFSSFPQQENEVAIFFCCLPKNTKMQYAKEQLRKLIGRK